VDLEAVDRVSLTQRVSYVKFTRLRRAPDGLRLSGAVAPIRSTFMKNLQVTKLLSTAAITFSLLAGGVPAAVSAATKDRPDTKPGNEGGGGGKTSPSSMANQYSIAEAALAAKFYAPYVFNALEAQYVDMDDNEYEKERKAALKKLVRQRSQFLSKAKSVKLKLQEQPCMYGEKPKQGSANIAENSICISINKLLEGEIAYSDVFKKVLGLYVHELSHLVGLNEEEAELIQNLVESQTQNLRADGNLIFLPGLYEETENAKDLLSLIEENILTKDSASICGAVGLGLFGITDLSTILDVEQAKIYGSWSEAFLLTRKENTEVEEMTVRTVAAILGFCNVRPSAKTRIDITTILAAFSESDVVSVNQLYFHLFKAIAPKMYDEIKEEFGEAAANKFISDSQDYNKFIKQNCAGDIKTCYGRNDVVIQKVLPGDLAALNRELQITRGVLNKVEGTLMSISWGAKQALKQIEDVRKNYDKIVAK